MPHEKLIRILNYIWLATLFPATVGVVAGALAHSFALGVKTFLLTECGMAVLSPLLGAVFGDSRRPSQRRKKH